MSKTIKHRFAHACILVKYIYTAVDRYTRILKAVAPQMLEEKGVKQEGHMGNDHYLTVFSRSLRCMRYPIVAAGKCRFGCHAATG